MGSLGYTLLFRIVCRHTYFSDERAQIFSVRPTPACEQMLKRYQLLFRPFSGGGAVYYKAESAPERNGLAQFNERLPFTFMLLSDDPNLMYYTDLDLATVGDPAVTVYQFDNLADFSVTHTAADQATELASQRLHPLGAPFIRGPLPIWPKRFIYSSPAGLLPPSAVLTVREKLTQQIVWQITLSSEAVSTVPFNLSSLSEGCYFLQVNEETIQNFYLSDTPAVQQWGRVDIYVGGTYQAPYLPKACAVLDDSGQPTAKTFVVTLSNRKTIWRYYISHALSAEQNYANYEMVALLKEGGLLGRSLEKDQLQEIRFTSAPMPERVNGQLAWVFESEEALPLWQTPTEQLSVVLRPDRNKTRSGRTINLPYPTPNMLKLDGNVPHQRVYSEIFVSL